MRKLLLSLLTQLRSPLGMHRAIARRTHEDAAILLTTLERHAPQLVRTYACQILHSLLPLLQPDSPPLTAAAVTYTLAELLPLAGPLLDPYAIDLLALFLSVS